MCLLKKIKVNLFFCVVLLLSFGELNAQEKRELPSKFRFVDVDKNDTISLEELKQSIRSVFADTTSSHQLKSVLNALSLVLNPNTNEVEWWTVDHRLLNFMLNDSTFNYALALSDSSFIKKPVQGGIKILTTKKKWNGDVEYYRDGVLVFTDKKFDRMQAEMDSAAARGDEIVDPREKFFYVSGAVTGIGQTYSSLKTDNMGDGAFARSTEPQYLSLITMSVDIIPWSNCNINLSPEVAVGNGLGNGAGMAAYPNALFGFPQQLPYFARAQIQQKFEMKASESRKLQSLTILAGRYIIQEAFDVNPYANDPRHDFLNFMHNMQGAWDASTTAYGWTYGGALNLSFKHSLFNFALASVDEEAGGDLVDKNFRNAYSLNAQFVQNFMINGRVGAIRVFGFFNRAKTGSYSNYGVDSSGLATFEDLRHYQGKFGGYIDANYLLPKGVGAFARVSWNNGKTESWGYTQSDFSVNAGLVCNPKIFFNHNDMFGVTASYNTISMGHRKFLEAGGGNFMVANNGILDFGAELVFETFYSFNLVKELYITPDYQFVMNPGYDQTRGNTHVFAVRFNADF